MTLPLDDLVLDRAAGGVLTIDLGALQSNYGLLARAAAPARCGAVVKADGYGLGASLVASALFACGCRDFFVAHLAEGMSLKRDLAPEAAIYVLNGLQPGAEPDCADAGVIPVLNSLPQIIAWSGLATARRSGLPAILQVDSGMSRLGLSPDDVAAVARRPALLAPLDLRFVMSHLACADEPDHPMNASQLACFETLRGLLPGTPTSLANSGGVLLDGRFHHDLARPGLALYGLSPTPGLGGDLRPVAALAARVIQIRSVPAGTAIGYGATFTAERPMRLATVAIGYADGWPRQLGNVGAGFYDGQRLPIVGRVSMDSTVFDVSGLREGALGEGSPIDLIGPHQTFDEVASASGTIAYEILTRLGDRFARRVIGRSNAPPRQQRS